MQNSPLLLLQLAQHTHGSTHKTRGAVTLLPFRPRRTNKLSRVGRARLESTEALARAQHVCTCASAGAYAARSCGRNRALLASYFSWRAPRFTCSVARCGREKRLAPAASTHSRSAVYVVCSTASLVVCYVGEPNTPPAQHNQHQTRTHDGRTRRTVNNACGARVLDRAAVCK